MSYSKVEKQVMEISQPIALELGYKIYDVEFVKEGPHHFLRLFIIGENGVNLDDCEVISRKLSEYLDSKNLIDKAYILEVSSPGIERVLKQEWHFNEAVGEKILVKCYKAVEGKKSIEGILTESNADFIVVDKIQIEKKNISKANIVFDFSNI